MVLGLGSKNKKPNSVQVDYTIHIQEIRPWPPSQSLKSLRSVVLQWENGDRNSGSTSAVVPGQSKIEFNESFKLQTTLRKESSSKSNAFQKNVLELNLYEPRRDKNAKGQLLGTAIVDLAEHGIIKEVTSFGVPLNCKRSYRSNAQPMVYVKIQVWDKGGLGSSPRSRESLSKEASLDKDGRESVSNSMSEEYAEEETEIASFTDDDISSHSSLPNSVSALEANVDSASQSSGREQAHRENLSEEVKEIRVTGAEPLTVKKEAEPEPALPSSNGMDIHQDSSFPHSSPVKSSTGTDSMDNVDISSSPQNKSALSSYKSDTSTTQYSRPSVTYKGLEEEKGSNITKEWIERNNLHHRDHEKMASCRHEEAVVETPESTAEFDQHRESLDLVSSCQSEERVGYKNSQGSKDASDELVKMHSAHNNFTEESSEARGKQHISDEKIAGFQCHTLETESSADNSHINSRTASMEGLEHGEHKHLQNALEKVGNSDVTTTSQNVLSMKGSRTLTSDGLRFSMRSPPHLMGNIRYEVTDQYIEDVKEIDVLQDVRDSGKKSIKHGRIDTPYNTSTSLDKLNNDSRSSRNNFADNKVRELGLRVEMLEGELREVAAIEMGIYSIVAEHGSSVHKVHTPARRLSRLYIHALIQGSQERKASTARSIVSGLVLAAKSCGNDVPRLAFWLSNSVVLRGIVTQVIGHADLPRSADPHSVVNVNKAKFSVKLESTSQKKEMFSSNKELDHWEDKYTLAAVLEKIEAWIFSRIVESIWWQTLTPRMQSANVADEPTTSSLMKDKFGRKSSLHEKQKANLSIEIWNKALNDACGRLCPVRAEGHECGCLPMLARLVMEQCVARLDVAMFNAILRESDDDIPTDPVSDPISDPKVLPIPPGKLSFGAGAQLKNAIGNWSRWLSDLFGMDEDDFPQVNTELDDDRLDVAAPFKPFFLLNAMSDLLMLPKDMLLEKSIRKEVCPSFTASMMKRILTRSLPDEFCPDQVPDELLEALDEDPLESTEEGIENFPCNASPVIYNPPAAGTLANIVGVVQSTSLRSSFIRKCHTSDDELDELDSPLASILTDNSSPSAKVKRNNNANVVRYRLLRDVWRSDG